MGQTQYWIKLSGVLMVVVLGYAGAMLFAGLHAPTDHDEKPTDSHNTAELHPVIINQPLGPPMVDSGKKDHLGNPVMIACSTCHAGREPNKQNYRQEDLNEFHQGLTYQHGSLTCLSCHNANNYDQLRLADGSEIEYPNVMKLCAQCHGSQYRDYQHGAHGGMNGYWDLKRGGRTRNNCIVCHDPHSPDYPLVRPVFEQKVRFPNKSKQSGKGGVKHHD